MASTYLLRIPCMQRLRALSQYRSCRLLKLFLLHTLQWQSIIAFMQHPKASVKKSCNLLSPSGGQGLDLTRLYNVKLQRILYSSERCRIQFCSAMQLSYSPTQEFEYHSDRMMRLHELLTFSTDPQHWIMDRAFNKAPAHTRQALMVCGDYLASNCLSAAILQLPLVLTSHLSMH